MSIPQSQFSISDKAFNGGAIADNLQALRAAGFTHLHFSHKWRTADWMTPEEIDQWQHDLQASGIAVLDVHGCHVSGVELWDEDPEARSGAIDFFRHRLAVTKRLGGDAMVYHVPCHVEPTPQLLDRFIDSLARLEATVRDLGLVVALENHYLLENDRRAFTAAFERFDADYITFTLDPGHAMISGNLGWLLANCRERLRILHLNDNDGTGDHHWNPFASDGAVDWDEIIKAIADSPYRKPIQLEVNWRPKIHGPHETFLRDAQTVARRIAADVAGQILQVEPDSVGTGKSTVG